MWTLLLATMGVLNRRVVLSCVSAAAVGPFAQPYASWAAVDCMKDCESNCNRVAPKSGRFVAAVTAPAVATACSLSPPPAIAPPLSPPLPSIALFPIANPILAPASRYCFDSCVDYCQQTDRRDGLSGTPLPFFYYV
jgi:hypothetical protein